MNPIVRDRYLPRLLGSVIAILLAVGVFTAVTSKNGKPLGFYDLGIGDSWAPGQRALTIVDRTGDPTWHAAIVAAIATWRGGGTELRFNLIDDSGPCAQRHQHIEFCPSSAAEIAKRGTDKEQGLFDPFVTDHHTYKSALILVCSDCAVDADRQVVIATHELGHALGLAHNPDYFSVMYYAGGTAMPDDADYIALRRLEGVSGPITGQVAP